MDKLAAMQSFVRVVETESFTKAAASLNMPKATVSSLVQALESSLRVRLLNRTTRRVSVTADGAAYYERAARILAEVEETESALTNATATPKGRLRIDVAAGMATRILMPQLHKFFALYPDIQLDVGCTDRPVNLIEEGVDCVIRGGTLDDSTLVARRVAELQLVTCATPTYLERYGRPEKPEDLARHVVVNYFSAKNGRIMDFDFEIDGETRTFPARHQVSVNDSNAYVAAGLAHLGLMQTAMVAVIEHLRQGSLVPVLTDYYSKGIPIYVLYPQNRHLSAKVRVFVEWVAGLFTECELMQARSAGRAAVGRAALATA